MTEPYSSSVLRHYQQIWGEPAYEAWWARGPIGELPASFRVVVFDPTRQRSVWVYSTCGMSDAPGESAIELHLFSPAEYSGHIELLTVVAHYHRTGHPLDVVGSTVNFGREWMPGSSLTYGLISRPYRDGRSLENLRDQDENVLLRCYWLLPITQSEREYKKQFGLEKLETLFDQLGLQYADPQRASVVQ
jgi:hypothetical protein